MVRGICTFKCPCCGHKFKDFDVEWQMTAFTAPVKCPKCGTMTDQKAGAFSDIWDNVRTLFKLWKISR